MKLEPPCQASNPPLLNLRALLSCLLLLQLTSIYTTPLVMANLDVIWFDCSTTANYTANSTFQTNLDLLLRSLPAAAAPTGFFNDSAGAPPDQVFELAICRGDLSPAECNDCLAAAVEKIVQNCPKGKSSTIWIENCLLRYSDQRFFSPAGTSYSNSLVNPKNATDPSAFNSLLGNLMSNLEEKAAFQSPKFFSTGFVNYSSFSNLYGLVQCTLDLSAQTCYQCLAGEVAAIPSCCDGKVGGRLYGANCFIRWEIYPFYNLPPLDQPPPPPPPPPSPPPPPPPPPPPMGKGKSRTPTIIAITVPISVVLLLIVAIWICLQRKSAARYRPYNRDVDRISFESLLFDLGTIRCATSNFADANKLGEGGFGPVYMGKLENGEEIAVKRLSRSSGQGFVELKNEVVLLAKLQHRNLVRLLGCCLEDQEKLLVYEYLPNKSLDKFLFDPTERELLDWPMRYKIIEGIARGLMYLHEDSRLRIIHRDLKASNILLDRDMNPKISDFGLAKLFEVDESQGNTSRIAGTFGYMAPEYAFHGMYSVKSDVYGYGVLLLEIITGQKNCELPSSGNFIDLVGYVWDHWTQGRALHVIDRSLGDRHAQFQAQRCIHIALLCVQEEAAQRPSMTAVILMLSSQSLTLTSPASPAFLASSFKAGDSESLSLSGKASSLIGVPDTQLKKLSNHKHSISEMAQR